MSNVTPVKVAYGDGIGPEIIGASLQIIQEKIPTRAWSTSSRTRWCCSTALLDQGIDIVKTESLRTYVGKPGYTLAQGQ
jgi:isocitrate/isopropylmalate dehydrogenase